MLKSVCMPAEMGVSLLDPTFLPRLLPQQLSPSKQDLKLHVQSTKSLQRWYPVMPLCARPGSPAT